MQMYEFTMKNLHGVRHTEEVTICQFFWAQRYRIGQTSLLWTPNVYY